MTHISDCVRVCLSVCVRTRGRSPSGGQPIHQGHLSGSRSHPGRNQERRSSGDGQDWTCDPAGAGVLEPHGGFRRVLDLSQSELFFVEL